LRKIQSEVVISVYIVPENALKLVTPAINCSTQRETRVLGQTINCPIERYKLNQGIIKIDTEGAELQVLRGAEQTLASRRPIILCEAWPDEMLSDACGKPGAVVDFLKSCGYSIHDCGPYEILAIPTEQTNRQLRSVSGQIDRMRYGG
jgi:hypothetical protein